MFGEGLVKGLSITLKHFFGKTITEQYPDVRPNLPKRFHGSFYLDNPKCIACGICANSCPNRVISLTTIKDENNKKKLDSYKMDVQYCLWCGLCVESCPTKAIQFTPKFESATYSRKDILLDLFKPGEATAPSGEASKETSQGQ